MIFKELRAVAPEAGCGFSDYSGAEVDLDGGDGAARSKNLRRRKTEIRRIKPVSDGKSGDLVVFPDRNGCIGKKKRSDVQREIKLMEEALLVESLGNDVVAAGVEHGSASIIGRRREMEDAVAAELGLVKRGGKSYDFFGVYDGHGGWRVARDCSEMLHNFVAEIAAGGDSCGEVAWERVMAAGFRKMDEEVNKSGAAVASTGSTAVVALVGEEEVVVANCGDSRAVLSRGGVAVQMSDDHKV